MWEKFGAVVLAAAAVLVTPGCAGARDGSGAGPLAWPKNAGTSVVGISVKRGQLAVTAIPIARTPNRAVLLDVRPRHAEDARGLRIRYAASTGRGLQIGAERGWNPSAWDLRPLVGFVIPPDARAAVVIGASGTKRGVYLLRGFVVDYRIGSTYYRAPQQWELRVCVAVSSCP